jgi:hypothetical protein
MQWPDIDYLYCTKCERKTTHAKGTQCAVCKTKRKAAS